VFICFHFRSTSGVPCAAERDGSGGQPVVSGGRVLRKPCGQPRLLAHQEHRPHAWTAGRRLHRAKSHGKKNSALWAQKVDLYFDVNLNFACTICALLAFSGHVRKCKSDEASVRRAAGVITFENAPRRFEFDSAKLRSLVFRPMHAFPLSSLLHVCV
jgi:hypothetical protein